MSLTTSERTLIEKIAKNLFLEGLIQAEQQAAVIEIINRALTDCNSK